MATGFQDDVFRQNDFLSNVELIDLESDIDEFSDDNTGSVQLENEGEVNSHDSGSVNMVVTKKPAKQCQMSVRINNDVIKFISNKRNYTQELNERLSNLNANAELIPEKSLIKVTKKPGSRSIREWHNKCSRAVTSFCKRFDKVSFELNDSTVNSVRSTLPRLGAMLRFSNAAFWMETGGKHLAVMTDQNEREQVLKKVREFLQISDDDSEEHGAVRKEKPPQTTVKIDGDIVKFLMKRKKYSEELKQQLAEFGAECQLNRKGRPGSTGPIVIKKVNSSFIENWAQRCKDRVNVFCNCFQKQYFPVDDSNWDSISEDLPKLQNNVSSSGGACWLDKNKRKLILVSLKVEFSDTVKEVEEFIQKFVHPLKYEVDESIASSPPVYFAGSTSTSRHEGTTPLAGPKIKLEPLSVKVNNDITKFVMKNISFSDELTDQLKKLNGEIQWKAGNSFVTVVQKSEEIFIANWSENCKKVVTKFFERFRRGTYEIQKEEQDLVCKGLPDVKKSISSSGADCWLTLSKRSLVLVGLKDTYPSAVVERFLQNVKEEIEKFKQIESFVEVSSDHVDYLKRTQFLETVKKSHPGVTEAVIDEARNQIRFAGSCKEVSAAKKQYEELVGKLNVSVLELPDEAMKLVSQRVGLEFIEKCLSERGIVSVILVESKSNVKIVAKSPQECINVKECVCENVRMAKIKLPSKNEHIFATKLWYETSKAIDSEELVDYQINYENETRREIKLHGATHLVGKYEKIVKDFIGSQIIEFRVMRLPSSGVSRFLKEKLSKELEKIEKELKDEQVKIVIESNRMECAGTTKGIIESKRRVIAVLGNISTTNEVYTSVGIDKLFSSEDGQRNIKGIEAVKNVIIEVAKSSITNRKESTSPEVKVILKEREQGKNEVKQVPLVRSDPLHIDPFDQCFFTTREGLKVWWKYGNIAQESADILVSSANPNLNNPSMIGRVLNSAGGPSFVTACSEHTNIRIGEIVVTTGGNLPCNYVIHAVCCRWKSETEPILRKLLRVILLQCGQLSARSVAMPLIGTGKHKFPETVVSRVMREEFETFSSAYPRSTLREIKLVRYDQGASTVPPQAGSGITRTTPLTSSSSSTFSPLVTGSAVETVQVCVFARSTADRASAFVDIEKFIQSQVATKKVEDEKLANIVVKHWDELERLAKDNGLRITLVNATTMSIEGMISKVVEAKELVNRFIAEEQRLNQLSYISENVRWYYTDERSGKEVAFTAKSNVKIEEARMNGKAKVEIVDQGSGLQYDVDFAQMVVRNKRNGQTMKLARKVVGSGTELSPPSSWSPQRDDQVILLVRLASSTREYLEVLNHFVARGGRADQLHVVERIQNPRLYSAFLAVKNSMRDQGNELRLFHGTDAVNTDSINAHNFSRSFAGVNGTAYGNGVYFARDASYSIRYAARGTHPKMYIAKVLVGEYTRGVKGMKAPPSKNDPNNPGVRYDSVVDHPSNPSMYIIFQDNQCYPEYLLTLKLQ